MIVTTKDYCDTCAHKAGDKKAVECRACMASYYDGVLQGSPSNYKAKPMTNADRIRAMSDEELAKAIASKAYTGACNDFDIPYDGKCCHNCEKCDAIIKWLKQPAEEGQ